MISGPQVATRVTFGLYEADLHTGELWKAGRKIRLQSQPFKVLTALLERPGEVVTKDELQVRLWGKGAVGDFDQSLGTAVNKIRDALGDTADNPRFVETLARRGYRFIAPVSFLTHPESAAEQPQISINSTSATTAVAVPLSVLPELEEPARAPESLTPSSPMEPPPVRPASLIPADTSAQLADLRRSVPGPFWLSWPSRLPWREGALVLLLGTVGVLGFLLFRREAMPAPLLRIERLTRIGRIAPGMPSTEDLAASASDGLRIFVPVLTGGRSVLSEVDVHTGAFQSLPVPHEIASVALGDLSPDLSTLLVRDHLSPESEQPLWLVPVGGGAALRLENVVGHDATWMPDGEGVLYASENQLIVYHRKEASSTPFAKLPGRAFWLRWSPDGSLLRFTLIDPVRHTMALWQLDRDGSHLRRLLEGWGKSTSECCGIWADGGKYFVFQSDRRESSDLWRLDGTDRTGPTRLTDGPLSFGAPAAPRTGSRIYFRGMESQAVLQIYDPVRHGFLPVPSFLSTASRVEYSRDKQWVLWTEPDGRLMKAKADGSEMSQLMPDSLRVFLAHWSPDGQKVVSMAREPGKAWQIYLVSASGGALDHLQLGSRNVADPAWSTDGRQIVFGRVSDVMGKDVGPRTLEILDLTTNTVTTVPGSAGLFSPRWSPDGRYIAALSLDQRDLLIFNTQTQTWHTMAQTTAADPVWAANSEAIYFHASLAESQPLYRILLPSGKLEQLARFDTNMGNATADNFFAGLTPENQPILRSRTGTGELYSLDLEER